MKYVRSKTSRTASQHLAGLPSACLASLRASRRLASLKMADPAPRDAARPVVRKTRQTLFKQPTLPGAAAVAGGINGGEPPQAAGIPVLTSKMEDNWVRQQFAADGKKCLHCPKSLSGSNVTRLKQHLLNSKACVGFLRSTAAAALASSDQEVRSALAALPSGVPGASNLTTSASNSNSSSQSVFQLDTISKADKLILDDGFIKMLIASNMSFAVPHQWWKIQQSWPSSRQSGRLTSCRPVTRCVCSGRKVLAASLAADSSASLLSAALPTPAASCLPLCCFHATWSRSSKSGGCWRRPSTSSCRLIAGRAPRARTTSLATLLPRLVWHAFWTLQPLERSRSQPSS